MIEFLLNERPFEFDETVVYSDFYIDQEGKPQLVNYNFKGLLEGMESGEIEFIEVEWKLWSRWVHEAPRKRRLREMRLNGQNVLTSEFLFEGDEEFINCLERTGVLAVRVCEVYSVTPMKPMRTKTSVQVLTPEVIEEIRDRIENDDIVE